MSNKYQYKVLYLDAITEEQLEKAIGFEIIPFLTHHEFKNYDRLIRCLRLLMKYTYLSPNQISKKDNIIKLSFLSVLGYNLYTIILNTDGSLDIDKDIIDMLRNSCPQYMRKIKFEKWKQ